MLLRNTNTGLEISMTVEDANVYLQRWGKVFEVIKATDEEEQELASFEKEKPTPIEEKIIGKKTIPNKTHKKSKAVD